MTKEIVLSKGKVALVDDDDFDRISQHKWYCNHYGYAIRKSFNDKIPDYLKPGYKSIRESGKIRWVAVIWLHREILNLRDNKIEVDHIDGDPLNNQRSNLRVCSHRQNNRNKKKYN